MPEIVKTKEPPHDNPKEQADNTQTFALLNARRHQVELQKGEVLRLSALTYLEEHGNHLMRVIDENE